MIVLITESLLQRSTATDGRILRDRFLQGFCVRLNKRKRTFLIATSVRGKQFRMMLGYWPLMSLDEARTKAMEVLRLCRNGERPSRDLPPEVPTMREAYVAYCKAKGIKPSSQRRYESFYRTHFGEWLDRPVSDMAHGAFTSHCHDFSQTKGKALVELGRGVIGALAKYVNAVHDLNIQSPFVKLAAAGLLPERTTPRARVLQEAELPAWHEAVDKLGERQRDFLYFVLYTGLRRNEARGLCRSQIDLTGGVLSVPETKTGRPHSLPITPLMREILERRCRGLEPEDQIFTGVSAEHVYEMAMRLGAPRFMLHDLRKMLATVGSKLGVDDAVLRRILNHTAPKTDVLHRHYVGLGGVDICNALIRIQGELKLLLNSESVSHLEL
jgi:integrase